jgi:hypothetical protein
VALQFKLLIELWRRQLESEVAVSETIRDLIYGSCIAFEDKGFQRLKCIEERKRLYSVVN